MPIIFGVDRVVVVAGDDVEVHTYPPCGADQSAWLTVTKCAAEGGVEFEKMAMERSGVLVQFKDIESVDVMMQALRAIRTSLVTAGVSTGNSPMRGGTQFARPAAWEEPETPSGGEGGEE